MSPRRRLRTRYQRVSEPAAPDVPASETPTPPAPASGTIEVTSVAIPVESIGEPAEAFEMLVSAEGEPAAVVEPARPRRHRARAVAALVGFALLAFGTGLFVFNNLVMPRLIHGVGQVTVPDLTNLTVEQAEQALRPLGLQVSRAGERFDPAVPRGFVLSQDPEAGIGVRGRKRISVVVSLGEEFSSVPELFGESVRGARLLIERAGLRAGAIVHAPSEEAGEGLVAGSDPGAESVLQRDTPVHLLVSTGAGEENFVMPELLGREIAGVRRQLDALGFRVEMPPAAPSLGTIVSQNPAPGSRITRSTVFQLQAAGRMIR
ncbi:MAG: PASTA domain-containing protein [Candidatus Eisenbacteria bacterium]